MNLIPVIGPFDIKVYGTQRGFINRPIEFILRNDNVAIEEIHIINPNGNYSSCDISGKELDGHLSLEYQPEEIGTHEIKIFPNKMNRNLFSSFEFNIYDSSKLSIKPDTNAIVGKVFKIRVDCLDTDGHGNLIASVEQGDRKLKSSIKRLKNGAGGNNSNSTSMSCSTPPNSANESCSFTVAATSNDTNAFEISFVPELESTCKVDIELVDTLENILYGDSIKIEAKALDFQVIPFPLFPFHINTKGSFNAHQQQLSEASSASSSASTAATFTMEPIECHLKQIESNLYECEFEPKSIDRHFVEIYFDNQLINFDRPIKIDIFDVSKIKAKMPSTISFGEMNTFIVDTTGAGEGNLEVIIKDGYDTLKAQLLKREKRKFEIGFLCERNMKHDIQVIFNGIQIKDSPFYLMPELLASRSVDSISEMNGADELAVIEGGPLDGLQCGEKMWIVVDCQTAPYYDSQFLVSDDTNLPIKHTKIQLEDGRWRIEFIPICVGLHQIQRLMQTVDNSLKAQILLKTNVLHYSAPRTVYGYKMYNLEDSVQLVFDAANFRVKDILPEVKDPNDEMVNHLDCKYLSDYMALKFVPENTGSYSISFYDRTSLKPIASSPYKVMVHEDLCEIMRSSGVYDLTRLVIAASNLPKDYDLKHINVIVKDPHDQVIQNCFFSNKKLDLVIEFITRKEGLHKIYLYIKNELVDDTPFFIHVNGDLFTAASSGSMTNSAVPIQAWPHLRQSSQTQRQLAGATSASANELGTTSSARSLESNSADSLAVAQQQHQPLKAASSSSSVICLAALGHGTISCAKKDVPFHFVISDKNIQGLCVYDPLNSQVQFKLSQDDHENGAVIFVPKLEGAHKIVGLVEGRDFEAQLFVLSKPSYEDLFEINNYSDENSVERPFVILLKEPNLEVDAYDPLGERVDVRYSGDNLATFVPRTTGYFKIYISDYHGPILGSPFYALVNAQPDSSANELACVESSGIRDTVRNEETKFIIRNKDLEIDVQIKNPQNVNLSLRKKRTVQGYLQVFYTPECIGPHEIHIFKDGVKVLGSPIIVFVSDPNEVKIENLEREAIVNKPFSFNIDANQAGEGFIRVNIKDPKLNDILPEITELSERKYLVSFLPRLPGIYEFLLTFNKYHIIESPFKVIARDENSTTTTSANETAQLFRNVLESSDLVKSKLVEELSPISKTSHYQQATRASPNIGEEENSIECELAGVGSAISQASSSHRQENSLAKSSGLGGRGGNDPVAAAAAAAAAIEYELNSWNLQLNNTLNKIMESSSNAIVIGNKRTLSPITDTSEEESHDLNGAIFRGETYIENVERLPDGSSHLLLRIEDGESNELIDSNDPNKTCGKYKYRFKRISLAGERWTRNTVTTNQPISQPLQEEKPKSQEQEIGKEIVKTAIEKAIERVSATSGGEEENTAMSSEATTETEHEYYTIVYTSQGLMRRESSKSKHHSSQTPTESIKKKIKIVSPTHSMSSFSTSSSAGVVLPSAPPPSRREESSLSKSCYHQHHMHHEEGDETMLISGAEDDDEMAEISETDEHIVIEHEAKKQRKTVVVEESLSKSKFEVIEDSRTKSTIEVVSKKPPAHPTHNHHSIEKEDEREEDEEVVKQEAASLCKSSLLSGDEKIAAMETETTPTVTVSYAEKIGLPIDEKFKPQETIRYEYEQVIEQPKKPSPSTTKVVKTKEKFEKLSSPSSSPSHAQKVRRTTTDLASLITEFESSSASNSSSNSRSSNVNKPGRHYHRAAKTSSSVPPKQSANIVDSKSKSLDSSSSYKLNPNAEEFTPRNFVSLAAAKFDSSISNENLLDFYKLQPTADMKVPSKPLYNDLIKPVEMSALQHGEQLKGGDESLSVDDMTTCSRQTTRKSGLADDEEEEDSLAECCEENYVITIKVDQEKSTAAVEPPPPPPQPQPASENVTASPTDEKLYYKPIETFTPEEFFKEEAKPTENGDSAPQQRGNNQLSDLKAKFEPQESKSGKVSPPQHDQVIGKLPKSKVELYDSNEKKQMNGSNTKQSSSSKQTGASDQTMSPTPSRSKAEKSGKKPSLALNKQLSEELPSSHRKTSSSLAGGDDGETNTSSSTTNVGGGVKSLLSKYEQQRRSASHHNPVETVSSSIGTVSTTPSSPTQLDSPTDTQTQQGQVVTSSRAVKKLPPSIVQMFDRRDSGLGGSEASLITSSKNSNASNSRLQKTPSCASSTAASSSSYAKSDTVGTTASSNDDAFIDDYLMPSAAAIIAEDSLAKSSTSSMVGKIAKQIISHYEKKDVSVSQPVLQNSSEQNFVTIANVVVSSQKIPAKSEPTLEKEKTTSGVVDSSSNNNKNSSVSEEPKKLPKSSFELYESKSTTEINKALRGRKEAPSKSSMQVIDTSQSSDSSSSPLTSPPQQPSNIIYVNKPGDVNSAFKSKQATIVLINGSQTTPQAPTESESAATLVAEDASTSETSSGGEKGVRDLVTKYEKPAISVNTPSPLSKLLSSSSLSPDAKPFEPRSSVVSTAATAPTVPPEVVSTTLFDSETKVTAPQPSTSQKETLPKPKRFSHSHDASVADTTVSESISTSVSTPSTVTTAAPSTSQPVKKKSASSSSGEEENAIKKLISKYEAPNKQLSSLSDEPSQKEPQSILSQTSAASETAAVVTKKPSTTTTQTSQQPQQPQQSQSSKEAKDKDIMASLDKGVKKLVGVYENKPQQTILVDSSPVSTQQQQPQQQAENKTQSIQQQQQPVPKKLPKSMYEKYEPKSTRQQSPKSSVPEQQHHVVYQPSSGHPEVRVFRSESSDLCAVLHIPSANNLGNTVGLTTSASTSSSRKSPKIRCVLKVDSDEPLVYNISTGSGRKVPFKVRHRNGKSIAVFGYHRVVDFNVAIESQTDAKPDFYRAELEIMVPDEYEFLIYQRDNLERVPIDISRDVVDNVYQISFEPKSTHNYILRSKLKNENEEEAISGRRRSCKSEFRLSSVNPTMQTGGAASSNRHSYSQHRPMSSSEYEIISRSRSQQSGKHQHHPEKRYSLYPDVSTSTSSSSSTNQASASQAKTLSSQQISEIGSILEKTKMEIHKKLNDLNASSIKVQLEVEYKDQLAFEVKKSIDGEPIDFQPVQNSDDRHVIYFNYDSIVDFSIGVKSRLSPDNESKPKEERLNAQIEVSVNGDYDFQIVKKDTQEPIDINVKPKENNVYKIEFHPNPVTGYTLKANRRCSECQQKSDKESQSTKMNQSKNDNKESKVSRLHCKIFNPKNLEISEMPQSNDSISFIVNTQNAGRGNLKCHATDPDGEPVQLEYKQLDKHIYSVKIIGNSSGNSSKVAAATKRPFFDRGYMNLYLEYQNAAGQATGYQNVKI